MITHRLQTRRTVRLVSLGQLQHDTRVIFIACHGYGMDVESFARSFGDLPPGLAILCPEGLSRFYWGGMSGKPVASWMTKLERDSEIEDFCGWLDRVLEMAQSGAPNAQIFGFGFSQGAATVTRWIQASQPTLAGLLLWAGTPPEDIDYQPRSTFDQLQRLAYWGDADELVPAAVAQKRFDEVPVKFEHRSFAGGHEINAAVLSLLLDELLDRSGEAG